MPSPQPLPPPPGDGVAGRGAQREYERRKEKDRVTREQIIATDEAWRARIVAEHPVAGRMQSVFTPKPNPPTKRQTTEAWKTGAQGEEKVAEVLAKADGIVALHDRRIPGSRANIDHIVVGPRGIFVIDAKKTTAKPVEIVDRGNWLRHDHHLKFGGRDQSSAVEGMARQVAAVELVLPDEHPPIRPIICVVGGTWGLIAAPLTINGVTVLWPKRLPKVVAKPGPLDAAAIQYFAALLRARLPEA